MKVKLGMRPKNFKRTVKFPMVDGTEGVIEVVFKYRTRTEFGKFIDDMMNAANEQADGQTAEDQRVSLGRALEKTKEANADYILQIAEGWNLEESFDRDNLAQLCDEIPGAAMAIMDVYRAAIVEGRMGN
jgi:hypothetical protein